MRVLNLVCVLLLAVAIVQSSPDVVRAEAIDVTDSDNVLAEKTVVSSSWLSPFWGNLATDNLIGSVDTENAQLFANSDTNSRLSISGFDSSLSMIRIYTDPNDARRMFTSVSIRSSSSLTSSLDSGDYETLAGGIADTSTATFVPFDPSGTTTSAAYVDIGAAAPEGTQSLLFSFVKSGDQGLRVTEVQGYAVVPEPSVAMLAISGLIGMLAYAWRKQK